MCRPVILRKMMAVPEPPLLILLSLLLSKASLPAAANTLTPRRQPQHKLLHLGEGPHKDMEVSGETGFNRLLALCPLRLAQGLWDGSLQTQHG